MSSELTADNDAACPGCGERLRSDVVLCVKCGYHRKLGRFLATTLGVQSRPGDPDNPYQSPAVDSSAEIKSRPGFRDILLYMFWIDGRAPRSHWWLSRLVWITFTVVLDIISDHQIYAIPARLQFAMLLPLFWVVIAMDVKRWHDRDKSGLWCFLYFVPCAGPVWILWELGCEQGDACRNDYGEDPLKR